jgi:hypothetical protein
MRLNRSSSPHLGDLHLQPTAEMGNLSKRSTYAEVPPATERNIPRHLGRVKENEKYQPDTAIKSERETLRIDRPASPSMRLNRCEEAKRSR